MQLAKVGKYVSITVGNHSFLHPLGELDVKHGPGSNPTVTLRSKYGHKNYSASYDDITGIVSADVADLVDQWMDWNQVSIITDNLVVWYQNSTAETVNTRVADSSGVGNRGELFSGRGVAHGGSTEIMWGDVVLSGAWTFSAHYYLAPGNAGSILFTQEGNLNSYIRPYGAGSGVRIRANGGSQLYVGTEDYTGDVFLTLSSNGTTVKVYKNGVYDGQITYSDTFTFGETHSGSVFDLMSVQIDTRQLSDAEILAMALNPEIAPNASNTQRRFQLNEGNHNIAYDDTGNGNGTISGGTWITSKGGIHPQTAIKSFNVREVVSSYPVMLSEGLTEGEDLLGTSITTPTEEGAYRFVGDGYILVPDDASMDSTNSFSIWVKADSTTEEIWEIVNSSVDIAVSGGTISATGVTAPTIYVDDSVSTALASGVWKMITVTTATGVNVGAQKIGMVGITGFNGQFKFPKAYTSQLSADDVSHNYNVAA